MRTIKAINAREILDSRGIPTIECEVFLDDGSYGIAQIASGTSTGRNEAVELRDNDPDRYMGKGVLKAVNNILSIIHPKLIGANADQQAKIDKLLIDLDGTKNKAKLGANAILAVSQAACEAAAASYKLSNYSYLTKKYGLNSRNIMPTPLFNIINGGKHGMLNTLNLQEFFVIPTERKTFSQGLEMADVIYFTLKNIFIKRGITVGVGFEGGLTPELFSNVDTFNIIKEAIAASKYNYLIDIFLGSDFAANSFYLDNTYRIREIPNPMHKDEYLSWIANIVQQYELFLIEDPLVEDDFKGWKELFDLVGDKTLIIGDDLVCTNLKLLRKALNPKCINGLIIKLNQIGTITETVEVVNEAKKNNIKIVVSHRSGETQDDFIADFSIGMGADYVKFGAPSRGERIAKYNRLLKIEKDFEILNNQKI